MTETTPALTCPKCSGAMRAYERNGILVDQCTGCRGIFLDRGELERLIDAENEFYRPSAGGVDVRPGGYAPRDTGRGLGDRYDRRRDDDRWHDDDDDRRGRGGFLGGLLDFD